MPDSCHIVEDVVRRGRQFVTYSDGTQQTPKVDPETGEPRGEWTQVESPAVTSTPTKEEEPVQLHVVARHQAEGEVTGDAEQMHYDHSPEGAAVNLFRADDYAWHQTVAINLNESTFAVVDAIARREEPPHAASWREVTENCQGWTIRVLQRLVAEGEDEGGCERKVVVDASKIAGLLAQMDPV